MMKREKKEEKRKRESEVELRGGVYLCWLGRTLGGGVIPDRNFL